MNFSWGSDPDSFSWSQRTWKQGDLIWNCERPMKQDDTRERTIFSIRTIFATMLTYHKVSAHTKMKARFSFRFRNHGRTFPVFSAIPYGSRVPKAAKLQ